MTVLDTDRNRGRLPFHGHVAQRQSRRSITVRPWFDTTLAYHSAFAFTERRHTEAPSVAPTRAQAGVDSGQGTVYGRLAQR